MIRLTSLHDQPAPRLLESAAHGGFGTYRSPRDRRDSLGRRVPADWVDRSSGFPVVGPTIVMSVGTSVS